MDNRGRQREVRRSATADVSARKTGFKRSYVEYDADSDATRSPSVNRYGNKRVAVDGGGFRALTASALEETTSRDCSEDEESYVSNGNLDRNADSSDCLLIEDSQVEKLYVLVYGSRRGVYLSWKSLQEAKDANKDVEKQVYKRFYCASRVRPWLESVTGLSRDNVNYDGIVKPLLDKLALVRPVYTGNCIHLKLWPSKRQEFQDVADEKDAVYTAVLNGKECNFRIRPYIAPAAREQTEAAELDESGRVVLNPEQKRLFRLYAEQHRRKKPAPEPESRARSDTPSFSSSQLANCSNRKYDDDTCDQVSKRSTRPSVSRDSDSEDTYTALRHADSVVKASSSKTVAGKVNDDKKKKKRSASSSGSGSTVSVAKHAATSSSSSASATSASASVSASEGKGFCKDRKHVAPDRSSLNSELSNSIEEYSKYTIVTPGAGNKK